MGSFYRAGGWEGRRCGEGNGRRRRCAFKAFNPSVTGGERRGEWGVKGRGNAVPFPREERLSGRRERTGEVAAAAPGQASRGRRRSGSLTGWAGKGGRRWATAGLEKKGGGRAETIARAEIQKSKRKSILIDFWIKIGLEIE
jgi:hypothetical protein